MNPTKYVGPHNCLRQGLTMHAQPIFTTPKQAIEFMRTCLLQNDPRVFFAAFSQETSDFWKERIFTSIQEIEATDTLEGVFLDGGQIISFPEHESILHLGSHSPSTHYLHINLVKIEHGWVLESVRVCR
jgi:hypothetical protein